MKQLHVSINDSSGYAKFTILTPIRYSLYL